MVSITKGDDMKKILVLAFVFAVGCASVSLTEKSNIIDLPGQSKQQIYQKSIQWITYKFVSGKAVIDYKDASTGRIIAKGSVYLATDMGILESVYVVGTIDCVSGKSKITIEPKGCQAGSMRGNLDCPCDGMHLMPDALKLIPVKIDEFMADYKNYMSGGRAPAWDGKS
jgi:hypothetical protein